MHLPIDGVCSTLFRWNDASADKSRKSIMVPCMWIVKVLHGYVLTGHGLKRGANVLQERRLRYDHADTVLYGRSTNLRHFQHRPNHLDSLSH